jgi:hypothetical protein
MKIKKKKFFGILFGCLIGIPIICFIILSSVILPSHKLTPLVVNLANKHLDATLTCDRIELTYFKTYPHLGIAIDKGTLTTDVASDSISNTLLANKPDTLVSFDQCIISFNPIAYLLTQTIGIQDFYLNKPTIYGYTNPKGVNNWDIVSTENKAIQDSIDQESTQIPTIYVKQMRIENGIVTFYDNPKELYTKIEGFHFNLNGDITSTSNNIQLKTGWEAFKFYSKAYSLENTLKLGIESDFVISEQMNKITLNHAEMMVNNLPFNLTGSIFNNEKLDQLDVNLQYGLEVDDLNTLLAFAPKGTIDQLNMQTEGSIALNGAINGSLTDSIYPVVTAYCALNNGSIERKNSNATDKIKELQLHLDMRLDMAHSDSSYVSLEKFLIESNSSAFTMHGGVTDLLDNPAVEASLKGHINFTELSQMLISPDTLVAAGDIDVDLNTEFRLIDLISSNYGKVKSQGSLSIDNFKVTSIPYEINLLITKARLLLDSQHQSDLSADKKHFNGTLSVDSLHINWKEHLLTRLGNLKLSLSAPAVLDTSAIIPLHASATFSTLRTLMPDSVWLWSGNTQVQGSISPSAKNKKQALLKAVVQMDSLAYLYSQYRSAVLLTGSQFNISAFPFQRDTAFVNRRKNKMNQKLKQDNKPKRVNESFLSGSTSDLLKRWDVRGNVLFKQFKASTPLLPIPIAMHGSTVQFTTNDMQLSNAKLLLGNSDLTLSGKISGLRSMLLRGGKIKGQLDVNSDRIDCNELISAASSGMIYAETLKQNQRHTAPAAQSDSITSDENFVDFEAATVLINDSTNTAPTDTAGLFVLPKFLNLDLHILAKKIDFKELKLENVLGEVIFQNQKIQVTDLSASSNMGDLDLTMNYVAKNKKSASTGFDLNLKKIQVDGLIGLFPAIDSLMPMMRSFKGIVDCQIAATCKLDSTFSIVLPSLHAASYMRGENLVLMDGEAFAEISKTLMFKNKKENLINNIAVDVVIDNNKIEVFPFLIEIDRYRVAVGGTHNLDMTYDYHISVLKSPVPFKLGVDVTGNLDDFKYRITKCKYKNIFKPAKTSEVDSTKLNIRQTVYDAIKKEINTSIKAKHTLSKDSIH